MKRVTRIILDFLVLFLLSITIMLFVLDFQRFEVAQNQANKVCDKLNPSEEYYCLAVVNQKEDFCEKLRDKNKNLCLALAKRNFQYCDQIKEKNLKESCYRKLILLDNKPEYCKKLEKEKACYFLYIADSYFKSNFDEIKTKYCEKVSGKNAIYEKTCLALQKNDRDLCDGRLFCLGFFENDLYLCKGITGEDKFKCFRDRALTSEDLSICEKISDSYWKSKCYLDYARYVKPELSVCDNIKDTNLKNLCYLKVAIRLSK